MRTQSINVKKHELFTDGKPFILDCSVDNSVFQTKIFNQVDRHLEKGFDLNG